MPYTSTKWYETILLDTYGSLLMTLTSVDGWTIILIFLFHFEEVFRKLKCYVLILLDDSLTHSSADGLTNIFLSAYCFICIGRGN